MHVRKGDTVVLISGNDKGHVGEIKRVYRESNRVLVDGANVRWKHKRGTEKNPKGERVQQELPIHVSNVMFYDAAAGKGVRKRPQES